MTALSPQYSWLALLLFFFVFFFFGRSTALIFGRTPPLAIVTFPKNLSSSSSFLTANWIYRGIIRRFLLSFAAFPASSSTSATMYSRTAAKYTGAPAPTRLAYPPCLRYRAIRPTGNVRPALLERLTVFDPLGTPRFPPKAILPDLADIL